MKKLGLLVLSLAVVGCSNITKSTINENSIPQELIVEEKAKEEQKEVNNETFSQPERNKNCIDNIENIKIFQTLDKYAALAFYNKTDEKYLSEVALLSNTLGDIMFYDGLKVDVPQNKCIVISDTYTYESKGEGRKTVPIITFDYAYPPMDEKEWIRRTDELKNRMRNIICEKSDEIKKQGFKNVEQCHCYADILIDNELGANKNTEKECGKLLNISTKPNKSKKVVNKK